MQISNKSLSLVPLIVKNNTHSPLARLPIKSAINSTISPETNILPPHVHMKPKEYKFILNALKLSNQPPSHAQEKPLLGNKETLLKSAFLAQETKPSFTSSSSSSFSFVGGFKLQDKSIQLPSKMPLQSPAIKEALNFASNSVTPKPNKLKMDNFTSKLNDMKLSTQTKEGEGKELKLPNKLKNTAFTSKLNDIYKVKENKEKTAESTANKEKSNLNLPQKYGTPVGPSLADVFKGMTLPPPPPPPPGSVSASVSEALVPSSLPDDLLASAPSEVPAPPPPPPPPPPPLPPASKPLEPLVFKKTRTSDESSPPPKKSQKEDMQANLFNELKMLLNQRKKDNDH